MLRRLFLFFCTLLCLAMPLFALKTACLNSSIADLWTLAGGSVDISVGEAVERGFAPPDASLVDDGSGRMVNVEVLLAYLPDLVLGSVDTLSHVRLKSLMDDLDLDMLLIREDSFEDFLSVFKTLTDITSRPDLYQKYGIMQKEGIDRIIEEAASFDDKPRVLFLRAGSAFSYVKAKRKDDHFAAAIISDLGAVNIADEYDALTESLSLEAVLSSDPDKILIVPQGDEEASRKYIEHLFSQPGWRDVRAIREGSVYYLDKELFHFKPNGRWLESYEVMKEVLYG